MKKTLFLLSVLLLSAFSAMAQEELNPKVKFYNGTTEYKKPSALLTIAGFAGAFSENNPGVLAEDKGMVDGIKEAIRSAGTYVYRLDVQLSEAPGGKTAEECYALNAKLSNVMSSNGKYGAGTRADIELMLVNLKTGKEVAKQKYEMYTNDYQTKAAAAEALNDKITARTVKFLMACFPLTGSVLQKGVEQLNGKVKEKQCYVDLGDMFMVYEGLPFIVYSEKDGKLKEIGTLKMTNTEGDDLGVCTIKKGDSKIEKAISDGEHLVIKSNESLK